MKIFNFSQLGKRGNNEDCLGVTAGLITVCDGMGGHNFGERASQYVVQQMTKNFEQPKSLNKTEIQQKLNEIQLGLNGLLEKEPELEKMGTTFTGIFITPDVWYAAHIGDSRIYLFRPSEQKLWHTWDHSLVGELMRTQEITIEAGRFHPMSNRISKAIIAHKGNQPSSASIVKIDELKTGDVFLLCSDGVVESWGDYDLIKLISDTNLSFEEKCEKLRQQCDKNSKDNNTAVLVEIEEKDAIKYGNNAELEWTPFSAVEDDYNQYLRDNEQADEQKEMFHEKKEIEEKQTPETHNESKGKLKINKNLLYIIIAIIIGLVVGVFLFPRLQVNNNNKQKESIEKQKQTYTGQDKSNNTDELYDYGVDFVKTEKNNTGNTHTNTKPVTDEASEKNNPINE